MTYKITDLYIYPVKSLAGIAVHEAYALTAGFRHDRRWMLTDHNHQFMTQRAFPEMAQISVQVDEDFITFKHKNLSHKMSVSSVENHPQEVKVWDDVALACDTDLYTNQWLSDMLHHKVRLMRLKDDQSRSHLSSATGAVYHVSLADGYPYLLVSDKSLDQLNEKLDKPVSVLRFRPNIVVTAAHAHEEDNWNEIHTPAAQFKNIKPCGRCIMVNVDPEQGLMTGKEPLSVLSSYRKSGNSVLFGTNMICIQEGIVKKNEYITVN
jgi:uncharacterized protein